MIELLTVVAIIGVLATLLAATLGSAKRKARKTASISNLRQIALAYTLYVDDHRKRPAMYASIVGEKYLAEKVLRCAEDKGNWAGQIESDSSQNFVVGAPSGGISPLLPVIDLPHSYFKSFDSPDEVWERIEKSALGGIAACQLHGIGRQDSAPSISAFQGLVLRALKDTSVISRQVFWNNDGRADGFPAGPATALFPGTMASELPLFLDETEP